MMPRVHGPGSPAPRAGPTCRPPSFVLYTGRKFLVLTELKPWLNTARTSVVVVAGRSLAVTRVQRTVSLVVERNAAAPGPDCRQLVHPATISEAPRCHQTRKSQKKILVPLDDDSESKI
jgi:hypothetical protein